MNSSGMLSSCTNYPPIRNIFKTVNLAVPIPFVEPTEIFGTVEINTSVTIPAAVIAGVSAISFVFSEETPITCSPFNFAINVDIPEITTVSLSSKVCGLACMYRYLSRFIPN